MHEIKLERRYHPIIKQGRQIRMKRLTKPVQKLKPEIGFHPP